MKVGFFLDLTESRFVYPAGESQREPIIDTVNLQVLELTSRILSQPPPDRRTLTPTP